MKKYCILMALVGVFFGKSVSAIPIQWSENGHWYEYVDTVTTWENARSLSMNLTRNKIPGYLITITSQAEDSFVTSNFGGSYWIGGYQQPDSPEPRGGYFWVTGESMDWNKNESDNSGGQSVLYNYAPGSYWDDDWPNSYPRPYIVEYGTYIDDGIHGNGIGHSVPEPSSIVLLLIGITAICGIRFSRRKTQNQV